MIEDEPAKLIRLIREKRQEYVERVAQGGVSAENCQGGYRHVTGIVNGLDEAIMIVQEVFKGWLPDAPKGAEHRRVPRDY